MKSLRLKRRNHKTRKIKKGGNGRSSQEILTNLLNLLDDYQSYLGDIDDLSREEPIDNIKIKQIQDDLNDLENSIISIFRNNSLDLSILSERQKEALLYAVLRTSGEIAEAYAHAYSNLETKEQMPIEIIDELINEFEIEIENIEIDIENGDDYDDEYDYYVNAFTYLNIIKQIIEQERPLRMNQKVGDTAITISNIQPMGTNKRYFLPPNVKKTIGEFIHDPRYYKHFSSMPKLYRNVISNMHENIKQMPSRKKANSSSLLSLSKKGGRRTRRK